jgi:hypothetical protein
MLGGFHSPMEKECLTLLLRGTQPVTVCPARGIDGMRLPGPWKQPLAEGRLLVLSPFDQRHRRATSETAHTRNLFVAALASQILVAHARPASKTEGFVRQIQTWNLPLWTVASRENEHLLQGGLKTLKPEDVPLWRTNGCRP